MNHKAMRLMQLAVEQSRTVPEFQELWNHYKLKFDRDTQDLYGRIGETFVRHYADPKTGLVPGLPPRDAADAVRLV